MKFFKFLFSGVFMGMLLLMFAISMAYATFIENDFDATTAKVLIYHSWWFQTIMILMVINFSGMIFTKRLYKKSKWNILVIHVAFIVIIVGAGITHYLGYEGQMHIRENQATNHFVSADTYIYALMSEGQETEMIYKKIWLTPIKSQTFDEKTTLNGKEVRLSVKKFIPNAIEEIEKDESGSPILTIIAATAFGRRSYFLKDGETIEIGGLPFAFNTASGADAVQIQLAGDSLMVLTPLPLLHLSMHGSDADTLIEGNRHPIKLMEIYQVGQIMFTLKALDKKAKLNYVSSGEESPSNAGIAVVEASVDDQSKTLNLVGGPGIVGRQEDFILGDIKFSVSVGASLWQLPFSLQLNKFILERYPGSRSPSSFASEITLIDKRDNVEKPYKIFMNNILSYKGFRFYQSSYDTDEKGTILSVNHDQLGTIVTYVGYFLLFASLLLSLFTPKTRFAKLSELIGEIHEERRQLIKMLAIFLISIVSIGTVEAQNERQNLITVDQKQADLFGELLMQTRDGRIIPVNTMNSDLLRKIYKKNSYKGLSADQVILSMLLQPAEWRKAPLIKVYDERVQELIGTSGDYASFLNFFNEQGQYKLKDQINNAYEKSPALRSKLEKELISVDERLNVCSMAIGGSFLTIFPLPGDPSHRWGTQNEFKRYLANIDSITSPVTLADYIKELETAVRTHDYTQVTEVLNALEEQQRQFGRAVIPSDTKINLEVFYNKANIFYRLFPVYLTLGMVLLALFLLQLFRPTLEFNKTTNVLLGLLWIAFIVQTAGLAIRWYISGHAPWSNGYESMIYIAWAIMLAGLVLRHKSTITLALTAILAGITLLTAHMSWLNPEITNLVPVLKSYWLTLHVATITASYGFFALASLMGFLNLCLMIFRNAKNFQRIHLTIRELTYIIEMAMMIGLVLLVIGNFLGGIWANESWGRYWGWDPKETWSLITIIVYTFVLHLRLIPSMKSLFSTNFGAMVGFGSVLMTYFGVNYYLSGLHSYAQGDPVPVPGFVYYTLLAILIVSVLAAYNAVKMDQKATIETQEE